MKSPAEADGTAARPSRLSMLYRCAIAGFFGSAGGLIGYGAATAIGDYAVCAAGRSPLTVALYVASASALAAWTLTVKN